MPMGICRHRQMYFNRLVHATNSAGWGVTGLRTRQAFCHNWNDHCLAPMVELLAMLDQVNLNMVQYTRVLFGGPWQEGMESSMRISITEYGPDADELEFVGSIPAGEDINTWGDAVWEVVEAGDLNTFMVDRKAITVPTSTQSLLPADRNNIALEPDTTYQARLKYTSTDPALESEYSDVVTFKTAAEQSTLG